MDASGGGSGEGNAGRHARDLRESTVDRPRLVKAGNVGMGVAVGGPTVGQTGTVDKLAAVDQFAAVDQLAAVDDSPALGDREADHMTVNRLRQSAHAMDEHVRQLLATVDVLNESLTSRVRHAACVTAQHSRTTEQLSQVSVTTTDRLERLTREFLRDISLLRNHFRIIKTLAETTSQVRAQVMRLEAQVARL